MPADRHPTRWVGEAVYKQGEDGYGHEVQIKGVVMSYCPMSTKFLLLYSDGSSEAVPIDEIGDHMPLLRQLPDAKRRSKKRKTKDRIEERTESQEPSRATAKRVKVVKKEPAEVTALTPPVSTSTFAAARPHVAPLASRFVQDMLWALTTTYNVSDAKQQALLATLDNRSEQPRAALARYIEEGGLDAMHQTLRDWACGAGEARDQSEDHRQKNSVKREPRPSPGNPVPYHAATKAPTSPRPRSRCDQHLKDLLSAAKSKPADKPAKVATPPAPPKSPELVDLTGDSDEGEEEDGDVQNARARRRLHFGRNSIIRFSVNGSVEDFRVQLKRSRQTKRPKMPKRSPKVQKVLLKMG